MNKYLLNCLILCLIACSTSDLSKAKIKLCLSHYSPQELEIFKKVGFHNYDRIKKWNRNISVSINGDGRQPGDYEVVSILISELSELISPLNISMIDSDSADIVVTFSSRNDKSYKYGSCKPTFQWLNFNVFNKAFITIFPTASGAFRRYTIYHEMMHAIGFNHPKFENERFQYFNSRIQGYSFDSIDESEHEAYLKKNSKYSELDKQLIKILYSPCLPPGYSVEELEKLSYSDEK